MAACCCAARAHWAQSLFTYASRATATSQRQQSHPSHERSFFDRPFPGDPVWLLQRSPGPWEDFSADPPWTDRVELKVRSLYAGRSAQFGGHIYGELAADTLAVLGVLPSGFRPTHSSRFVLASPGGRPTSRSDLTLAASGQVLLFLRAALSDVAFRVAYPI